MADADLPAGYRDTLLFKFCGDEESYRAARGRIAAAKREGAKLRLAPSVYDARYAVDNTLSSSSPQITTCQDGHGPTIAPPPDHRSDLQRLQQLIRDYPDAVRSILAPVILDIVEEFLQGDEIDVETEGQGTQG